MDRRDFEQTRKLRIPTAIPVKVTPQPGQKASVACTLDVSRNGARLNSAHPSVERGDVLEIQYRGQRALFRVVWIGDPTNKTQGQFGVECLETGRHFWQEKPMIGARALLGFK